MATPSNSGRSGLHTQAGTCSRRRLTHLITHLAPAAASAPVKPFYKYSELLVELEQRRKGRSLTVLDHSPDGSPLVVVKCGGEKLPPVFISAGAHSTEQAGVVAAVQLVNEMRTEHAVYILPCRDPVGLNGFAAALKLGLGAGAPEKMPSTVVAAAALLSEKGEIIFDEEGGRLIALLGDHAYTINQRFSNSMISAGDPTLTTGPVHDALIGRRIYWPSNCESFRSAALSPPKLPPPSTSFCPV